jgi:hypothetical protein
MTFVGRSDQDVPDSGNGPPLTQLAGTALWRAKW